MATDDNLDAVLKEQHTTDLANMQAEVPQQEQDKQPGDTLPPENKPKNQTEIYKLSKSEFNQCLQKTLAYFKGKKVKIPDGRIGNVVGVDPRPMKGQSTNAGNDGNYLVIRVSKIAQPGRHSSENVWYMPDDLTIVEQTTKNQDLKT